MISRFATRRLIDASATLDSADRALLNIWVNRGLDDEAMARMTGLSVETITERRARVVSNLSEVLGLPPEHVRSALTEIAVVPDASPDTPSGPDALTAPTAADLAPSAPDEALPAAPDDLPPAAPDDLPPTAPDDLAPTAPDDLPPTAPDDLAPTAADDLSPAAPAADGPPPAAAAPPAAVAESPATAGTPPTAESPDTDLPPRRRRGAWIALIAGVVAAAVVLIIVLASGGSGRRHPAAHPPATTASSATPTSATAVASTTTPPASASTTTPPASASTTPTTPTTPTAPTTSAAPSTRPGTERLAALPGGLAAASGTVRLARFARKLSLNLSVSNLPPASHGHYEVWLYQSLIDSEPLGRLRNGARRLSVGLPRDAHRYPWIDISLQPPGAVFPSGDSVLRATNPVYGKTQ